MKFFWLKKKKRKKVANAVKAAVQQMCFQHHDIPR